MAPTPRRLPKPQPPVVLLTMLAVLAGLAVVVGVLAALVVLVSGARAGALTLTSICLAVGCILSGVVVGCLLWAIAHIIRRQSRTALLHASAERTLQARGAEEALIPGQAAAEDGGDVLAGAPSADLFAGEGGASQRRLLQQVLAELRELNENLLLSPEQRQAKSRQRRQRLAGELAEAVEGAIEAERFDEADQRLQEFLDQAPDDPACQALQARLIEARDAARARDIETTTRRAVDLMAVSSFEQAEQAARELLDRYPDEPHLAELIDRVRREGTMFHGERRDRLYREVQRHAEARRWREALDAAHRLVDAFPQSVDADAVRAMLPTIEGNARIEEVRAIRDRIRDLIERRRYAEAVEVAEDVIARFPETRAAEELCRQLDRLRELSRAPAANRSNGP